MTAIDECQVQVLSLADDHSHQTHAQDQLVDESADLVHREMYKHKSSYSLFKTKLKRITCLKSKSAILLLVWSFLTSALQWNYDPSTLIITVTTGIDASYGVAFLKVVIGVYAFFALLQLVYPLAGLLADIRYGRYKCVIGSLWTFVIGCCFIPVLAGVVCSPFYLPLDSQPWSYAILVAVLAMVGIPLIITMLLFCFSITAFNANAIQFGLDQLLDSPTEHLVLYIHLYVILYYAGTILLKSFSSIFHVIYLSDCSFSFWINSLIVVLICVFLCFLVLCTSLLMGYCNRYSCFVRDPGSRNPYKLVYNVVCFARKHSSPIQRSAFTYCEDELPTRLDLGKEKYGGPFTTEQVENVKVFVNILKVLVSLGPIFAVEKSTNILQLPFSLHLSGQVTSCIQTPLFLDLLPLLFSIVLLALYVSILRPLISDYLPGILKRIWFGIILFIIPMICFFILDTVGHLKTSPNNSECFLTNIHSYMFKNSSEILHINSFFLFVPNFFYSCGYLIFRISIFEFICSQSPHSMKGLLIGTFYAIRGIFQLLGALLFMFPFLGWRLSSFPSCGFAYYLINIFVALIGIVAYMWVARRYRNRQRDEPDNIYRYAEEYYDKTQAEPNSDDENYDNLNVQTIG